jgi:glycosyltransferase involved in cell wall biosynthesis
VRIALISHTGLYWTRLYAQHLSREGHDVRVISMSREPLEGVSVEYVGAGTPSRAKAFAYLACVPGVRSLLRSFGPDVVLATYVSSNGLVAALAGARPLVVSAHGSDVLGATAVGWARSRMLRYTCDRAAAVHAVSEPIAASLAASGTAQRRISCFPIGIDTDEFSPLPAHSASQDGPEVVCTRNQADVYRNDTLVQALATLRDEGLTLRGALLGGGPLLEERRAQVRTLGLEELVALPGRVSLDEVRSTLRQSLIYVSASARDGASSSLLEAMSCGIFPVVSAIPANTAWVDDGATALLFEPGDSRGLAEAIRRAHADDGLRARAAPLNRARVLAEGDIAVNMARMERLLVEVAQDAAVR